MTTINPMRPFGTGLVVLLSDINDDWVYIVGGGHYKRAEVLAALGVGDYDQIKADLGTARGALRLALQQHEQAKARPDGDRTERAAAPVPITLADIRKGDTVRAEYVGIAHENHGEGYWSTETGETLVNPCIEGWTYTLVHRPEPKFVLPTEAGARFHAVDPNGDPVEVVVYGSGDDGYRVYRVVGRWEFHDAGSIMSGFTGHRLLGEAEENP
jgi:hypothetical protein